MPRRSLVLVSLCGSALLAFGSCSDDEPSKPLADGAVTFARACVASCSTSADCPASYDYTCEGGLCIQNWCRSDADCQAETLPHCVHNSFSRQCVPAGCDRKADCTGGEECQLVFPGYKGCINGSIACASDAQCFNADQARPQRTGHLYCQDGHCGCGGDSDCEGARPTAPKGWKCLAWSGSYTRLK